MNRIDFLFDTVNKQQQISQQLLQEQDLKLVQIAILYAYVKTN